MKPMRRFLPYLTVLMLAVGSPLALLLLSPTTLWAAPAPIISSITLPFEPAAVATDSANNLIYVVDQANFRIRVVDLTTGNLLPNSFPTDPKIGVNRIAVDGARRRLFVSYFCGGCAGYVQVFNLDTYQEVSQVWQASGLAGIAVNSDNGHVYVAVEGWNQVWVLYPTPAGTYYLGNSITGFNTKPNDVTYDNVHKLLYVSIHHANEVAVVDTITETIIGTVPVLEGNPTSVAVNPNDSKVYVGQNLGNRISVVDGVTDTALYNITLGDGPIAVGVDPTTDRVFVGIRNFMSVGIVDGNTDTVICPLIGIGGVPTGLSVNTTDHCAYVGVQEQQSIVKVCGCFTADAGLNIKLLSEAVAATTISGIATQSYAEETLSYSWLEGEVELLGWTTVKPDGSCPLALNQLSIGLGTHNLTLKVKDSNEAIASDDMILTIGNSAPHAAPTGAGTYEQNSSVVLGGQVSDFDGDLLSYSWMEGQQVLFSGTIQTVSGGVPVDLPSLTVSSFAMGTHTIVLQTDDHINPPVQSGVVVTITEDIPPRLAPIVNKAILWPPNHKMVTITIQANASDNGGMPVSLSASVSSNEPVDDPAGDWTTPVIDQATGTITLQLRADRLGKGNGRQYTITITATDQSGNESTASVKIIVPHDQAKN